MSTLEPQVAASTRVIHVFEREGDIAEVFDQFNQLTHTGVVVRAAHNRSLEDDPIAYGKSSRLCPSGLTTPLS